MTPVAPRISDVLVYTPSCGPALKFQHCYNSLPHNDLLGYGELLAAHRRMHRVMLVQGRAGSRTAVSSG
jgi:hypothetical protein